MLCFLLVFLSADLITALYLSEVLPGLTEYIMVFLLLKYPRYKQDKKYPEGEKKSIQFSPCLPHLLSVAHLLSSKHFLSKPNHRLWQSISETMQESCGDITNKCRESLWPGIKVSKGIHSGLTRRLLDTIKRCVSSAVMDGWEALGPVCGLR